VLRYLGSDRVGAAWKIDGATAGAQGR